MTKPTLLYNKKVSVTAKSLASALNMRAVRDDRWTVDMGQPVIRWGSSRVTFRYPNEDMSLNTGFSISIASNGINMFTAFNDAGVYCPEYRGGLPEGFMGFDGTWLARKINHVGGKDIRLINTNEQLLQAMRDGYRFFVKFVPTSLELRVHVINGEVVKAFKKINDDPEASIIRTSYRGWKFTRVNIFNHYPRAIPIAINAMKAVGLVFGAVDMAWDINRHEWIVWEVNSAPSLNAETLNLYVTKLKELI